MKLTVHCGPPGCGKTRQMLDEMLNVPGHYLLCAPRTALIDEQAAYLAAHAETSGISVEIRTIHSDQICRGSVVRRARDALRAEREFDMMKHVVVLITHETLMALEPAEMAGWNVRIDEVLDASFVSGSMRLGASWSSLAHHYALEPLQGTSWAIVRARDGVKPPTPQQIGQDAVGTLAGLHKAMLGTNRHIFVDVTEWADPGQVRWWSMWSLGGLAECASVEMTGASFFDSLAFHATRMFDPSVEVVTRVPVLRASSANRRVIIHYYTAAHHGSTSWWETDEGSWCLVQISRHLERIGFDGFWAANDTAVPYFRHRIGGERCRPKLAGTNSLRHHTVCMAIYSAKAVEGDDAAIEVLGIDPASIRCAREGEDVFQFCMRGSLRDPAWSGSYEVHLYSRDQAEALAHRLRSAGLVTDIEIVPVWEAGVMEVTRPTPNRISETRPRSAGAATERRERLKVKERQRGQQRRQEVRERRIAEGTHRGRGRPRKSAE